MKSFFLSAFLLLSAQVSMAKCSNFITGTQRDITEGYCDNLEQQQLKQRYCSPNSGTCIEFDSASLASTTGNSAYKFMEDLAFNLESISHEDVITLLGIRRINGQGNQGLAQEKLTEFILSKQN